MVADTAAYMGISTKDCWWHLKGSKKHLTKASKDDNVYVITLSEDYERTEDHGILRYLEFKCIH